MALTSSKRSGSAKRDNLEELLRDRPSDEKGGVSSILGFTFQQWWAALSIAELLGDSEDFAVGLEVKEDIAILDSGVTPTRVEFCQVKKHEREGAWNLKELHKRGAKRKDGTYEPSILPSIQINIRAGQFPPAEEDGVSYLKIPLNALGQLEAHDEEGGKS